MSFMILQMMTLGTQKGFSGFRINIHLIKVINGTSSLRYY